MPSSIFIHCANAQAVGVIASLTQLRQQLVVARHRAFILTGCLAIVAQGNDACQRTFGNITPTNSSVPVTIQRQQLGNFEAPQSQ